LYKSGYIMKGGSTFKNNHVGSNLARRQRLRVWALGALCIEFCVRIAECQHGALKGDPPFALKQPSSTTEDMTRMIDLLSLE